MSARRPWPEEVRAEALRLRSEGMLLREVVAALGVPRATIAQWEGDPDGSRARARKDRYRGTCSACGTATTGNNGKAAPTLCVTCYEHRHGERNARIFAAWTAGEDTELIATREGMPPDAVRTLVNWYRRKRGEALPLRHRHHRELWPLIERRWNEGATGAEIAAEAATTKENVWVMVQVMRRAGIDLTRRDRVAA